MHESLADIAAEFEDDFEIEAHSSTSKPQNVDKTVVKAASKTHSILVNRKQRGNPLLKSISNVPWEFDEIIPDYQMGVGICALFLSLRYHNLNPDYIHDRLKQLGQSYQLRVLLVQVDINDPHHVLKTLTRICLLADLTLILAWSPEEAGKIIETYKIYENKPAEGLMVKGETSAYLNLITALTSIQKINKTDAMTLIKRFKTLKGIIEARESELADCLGLGPIKAKKLYQTLHMNFCKNK